MTEKPTEDQMVRMLAERWMGWECRNTYGIRSEVVGCSFFFAGEFIREFVPWQSQYNWNPFTSPGDAMMLMEKMRELGWTYRILTRSRGSQVEVRFWKFDSPCYEKTADTPCRAIALAAAAALEGE